MSSLQGTEACPAHWFGDAGYPDRPRGESEPQPPVPPYPLPSVTLAEPVQLEPGDAFTAPKLEIWMIEAAPNACQRVTIYPSYSANWEFVNVQAYATVSGTITDSVSGAPVGDTTVTITGTTDNGVESETVATGVDGIYASTLQFHADTVVTVEASATGYEATSGTATVVEGANAINLTMTQIPPAAVGVSGTVTDATSGAPIPGATVTLTGTGADGTPLIITLTANDQGAWASDAVFADGSAVTVETSAPGYEATSGTVSATEGANSVDLTMVPLPAAAVGASGTVTDATSGAPIPGATVTLTGTDPNGEPLTLSLTADSQGAWSSDTVFAVGSDVTASGTATGYQPASVTTTTGPDGVSGINLQLVADVGETPDPETPVPTQDPGTETPIPTEDPGTETPVPTDVPTETPGTETPVPTEAVAPTETVAPTSGTTPVPDPGETPVTGDTTSPVTSLPETGSGHQSSKIYLSVAGLMLLALGALGIRFARRG